MKITIEKPLPVTPPKIVQVTLTQEEADLLYHLAACRYSTTLCTRESEVRGFAKDLCIALNRA